MDSPTVRWRELYQSALLELDRNKLLQYIDLAEQAILREHANTQIEPRHPPGHEWQAMQDALHALDLLRRNALRD
jgi:hypothetical protein